MKVVMPFSVTEGRLTDEARAALQIGGNELRRYLPLPASLPVPTPAPPDEEMATPEEVAELMSKIAARAAGKGLRRIAGAVQASPNAQESPVNEGAGD
jgi:hypothetical protein